MRGSWWLAHSDGSSTTLAHRCSAQCGRRSDAMRGDTPRNAPFRSFRSLRFCSNRIFSITSYGSLRKGIPRCKRCTCRRCTLASICESGREKGRKTAIRVRGQFCIGCRNDLEGAETKMRVGQKISTERRPVNPTNRWWCRSYGVLTGAELPGCSDWPQSRLVSLHN
jgi:hypothetical protein